MTITYFENVLKICEIHIHTTNSLKQPAVVVVMQFIDWIRLWAD